MHDTDGRVVNQVRNDVGLSRALLASGGDAVERHGHGLSGSGALVQQTAVGDGKASQVRNHSLEVEQRLQTTLADLSLVRSVAGVPGRVLEHVALDDGRDLDGVVAAAVHPRLELIACVHGLEGLSYTALAVGLVLNGFLGRQHDVGRNNLRQERIKRLGTGAEGLEHGVDVGVARTNVARNEVLPWLRVLGLGLLHLDVGRVLLEAVKLQVATTGIFSSAVLDLSRDVGGGGDAAKRQSSLCSGNRLAGDGRGRSSQGSRSSSGEGQSRGHCDEQRSEAENTRASISNWYETGPLEWVVWRMSEGRRRRRRDEEGKRRGRRKI